jgi:hypothetical protein
MKTHDTSNFRFAKSNFKILLFVIFLIALVNFIDYFDTTIAKEVSQFNQAVLVVCGIGLGAIVLVFIMAIFS